MSLVEIVIIVIGVGLIFQAIFNIFNNKEEEQETNIENTTDTVTTDDMILHDMVNEDTTWNIGEIDFND